MNPINRALYMGAYMYMGFLEMGPIHIIYVYIAPAESEACLSGSCMFVLGCAKIVVEFQ